MNVSKKYPKRKILNGLAERQECEYIILYTKGHAREKLDRDSLEDSKRYDAKLNELR